MMQDDWMIAGMLVVIAAVVILTIYALFSIVSMPPCTLDQLLHHNETQTIYLKGGNTIVYTTTPEGKCRVR